MRQIFIILGTKAELIKLSPIMSALQQKNISYRFIFTGQHQNTVEDLRKNFGIKKPNVTLYTGKDITRIFQMAGWIIKVIWKVLVHKKEIFGSHIQKNDIVIVHGDTVSTLLGAIMGKVAGIKIVHVEAGGRSHNLLSPFPEEICRTVTDKLSYICFAPNDRDEENLKGYSATVINTKYNTVSDCLDIALKNIHNSTVKIPKEKYALCMIHRFENIVHKEKFRKIIEQIVFASSHIKILFVLHAPTKEHLIKYNLMHLLEKNQNIEMRPRYDYFDFIALMHSSQCVISDGGSIQTEAWLMGKPCLIMRDVAEYKDGIGSSSLLSKHDPAVMKKFIQNIDLYKRPPFRPEHSPTEIILDTIIEK